MHLSQYFEQGNVFNAINFTTGPYVAANTTGFGTDLSLLWCPSDGTISSLTSNTGNGFDGVDHPATVHGLRGLRGPHHVFPLAR